MGTAPAGQATTVLPSAASAAAGPAIAAPAATAIPALAAAATAIAAPGASITPQSHTAVAQAPDLGPSVTVIDPSMSVAQITSIFAAVAARQSSNQFGPERDAILFKPGTYGSATEPLNVQVGYNTTVAGLGLSPRDVVVNGSINVYNQCDASGCIALNNFWRSLSNLTIAVTDAPTAGCYAGEFWAVSQAAPMRRVNVEGKTTLMDYCTGPSFASGGFIADSQFDTVVNGSQQQWFIRDSAVTSWSNGVWNQAFSGVVGAPAPCFPQQSGCGPYTVIDRTPVSREAPFLYVDGAGAWQVFVPAVRHDSSGPSWASGSTAGRSIPLDRFVIARPGDDASALTRSLNRKDGILFTPGQYAFDTALSVKRAGTVVLGLGLATITPTAGNAAITVADVPGVQLSGLVVDAGPVESPVLVQIGNPGKKKADYRSDPIAVHDLFVRIGGAAAGSARVSVQVDANDTILDNIWAWRADHGAGVGWDVNRADTGLIVNADRVVATGLFVEHYQKDEVIWRGEQGRVIFFQNEMPYDPPSQAAWMRTPTTRGYPALVVADGVRSFSGVAMGSYSFFNQGVDIYADNAFLVPSTLPAGSLRNLLTIFLDPSRGRGGILNVINGIGGPATIANPDVPVTVTSYP